MRWVLTCIVALLLSLSAKAQCADQAGDPYATVLIRQTLAHPASQGSGFSEKQLNRLGDKSAVALLKVLSADELQKPATIERLLPIIRQSFQAPKLIALPEDRRPDVTLFLLGYIHDKMPDSLLRRQVSATIAFVKSQAWPRETKPEPNMK